MRAPSARCLPNLVDVYPATPGQDASGGIQYTYPLSSLRGVPCSVQGQGAGEEVDEHGRITPVNVYHVIFGANDPGLTSRDKLVQTDVSPARTLYVQGNSPSEAGRGSVFLLRAIERL